LQFLYVKALSQQHKHKYKHTTQTQTHKYKETQTTESKRGRSTAEWGCELQWPGKWLFCAL